ncbi:hypothetical protein Tco_0653418 [Tanacetum coccineum]|uniref:Uncharacterized protein n=1 Tax=Tanacetum coccineum TaxID=301880 RepID=A0ABQ4X0C3_9ASTR
MVICKICSNHGVYQHEVRTDLKRFSRGNVSVDFLFSSFSDEGSQVWKDDGGQILCSFFVSDDNIEFLEQKDPPLQSRLAYF